jgi:chromatin segregation and condensation protein Rec8/ScpA/Scc1 (kleisin family)
MGDSAFEGRAPGAWVIMSAGWRFTLPMWTGTRLVPWLRLLARARLNRHHRVTREELSVREHMTRILRRLKGHPYVEFFSLFEPQAGVPVIVVNLLALLELCRESMIHITQQAPFAPIHVRLAGGSPEEEQPVAATGSAET